MQQSLRTTPPAREPTTDFRNLFELSSELLCTADAGGRFRETNPSFVRALGYGAEELLGRSYLELVHPEDLAATEARTAELALGPDVVSFGNRYRCNDGSYRWLSWSIKPDPDHGVLYCAVRDVTERRDHDAVVATLLAELERSNTDLAQFAYVASHDLSEPLRMVSSYVQLLADRYSGQLDDDADEFIAFAVDGANRMKVLIDDLLAYSRAGGATQARRRVDCGVLVDAILADLRAAGESAADVVIEKLPVVDGDPGQLSQVFQNLLTNAVKFVPPGVAAKVVVSAERMGNAWCFSVRDNGIGIAEEHQKRIFLMFKRLHGRSEYPGTGIGLALCHKIVTRIGGRIWTESTTGDGCDFRFTVPDVAPAAEVVA